MDNEITPNKPRELTPANRVFLQLLSEGKSTLDAYKQAGYTGQAHAAYELRSQLNQHLKALLNGKGIDAPGLMLELERLNALPVTDSKISVKDKINLLKLWKSVVDERSAGDKPKITAFVLKQSFDGKDAPTQSIETSEG